MIRTFSGSNHKKIRTFSLSPKIRRSYKKKECIQFRVLDFKRKILFKLTLLPDDLLPPLLVAEHKLIKRDSSTNKIAVKGLLVEQNRAMGIL